MALRGSGACDCCMGVPAPMRCDGCGAVAWCSPACAAAAGAGHVASGECAAFAAAATRFAPGGGDMDDMPHRFALRVLARVACAASTVPPGGGSDNTLARAALAAAAAAAPGADAAEASLPALLAQLDAHAPPDASSDARALASLADALLAVAADAGVRHGLSAGALRALVCAVKCNAHTLYAHEHATAVPAGVGLFLAGTHLFNHSCAPSCEFYNVGTTLCVRALVDVPRGAELTTGYVCLERSATQRRAELLSQYDFLCDCERCGVAAQAAAAAATAPDDAQPPQRALEPPQGPPLSDWEACLASAHAALRALDGRSPRPGRSTAAALLRIHLAEELLRFGEWRRAAAAPYAAMAARFTPAASGADAPGGADAGAAGAPARMQLALSCAAPLLEEASQIDAAAHTLLCDALDVLRVARGADHPLCLQLATRCCA
jgi:SET and MYND domain-containing protein